jgi:hypothetical protein
LPMMTTRMAGILAGRCPCVTQVTVAAAALRHHALHAMTYPSAATKESIMSRHFRKVSPRQAVEDVFAGIVSAAILALFAGGTISMCVPDVLRYVA